MLRALPPSASGTSTVVELDPLNESGEADVSMSPSNLCGRCIQKDGMPLCHRQEFTRL